jgi:hypothetical protein
METRKNKRLQRGRQHGTVCPNLSSHHIRATLYLGTTFPYPTRGAAQQQQQAYILVDYPTMCTQLTSSFPPAGHICHIIEWLSELSAMAVVHTQDDGTVCTTHESCQENCMLQHPSPQGGTAKNSAPPRPQLNTAHCTSKPQVTNQQTQSPRGMASGEMPVICRPTSRKAAKHHGRAYVVAKGTAYPCNNCDE